MRSRAEAFGAWVRLDDTTLVAVSRAGAARLGVAGGDAWQGPPIAPADIAAARPIEVHLAVTARCGAGCSGCYVDARPDGAVPERAELVARLAAIAEAGAFTVAFGGGEPMTRTDLGELAGAARDLGLTPVVTTSGIGLTPERARTLRAFAQVNVSYDGPAEVYALVRGFDGAGAAERAMTSLREAGVPFGINVVLTRQTIDRLDETLARAVALGAREAQLLRYKPAGRARDLGYLAQRLAPAQVDALGATLERLSREHAIAIRIDCALVPLLSGGAMDAGSLARFGVFGCEAGRYLGAVRVDGAAAPCSFAPRAEAGAHAPAGDPLVTWREPVDAEPCASCDLRPVCRGGCRVVSTHLAGVIAPDPECPRVRRHAGPAASVSG